MLKRSWTCVPLTLLLPSYHGILFKQSFFRLSEAWTRYRHHLRNFITRCEMQRTELRDKNCAKKIGLEIKAADVGLLTNAIIVSYPFVSKEPLAPSGGIGQTIVCHSFREKNSGREIT